MVERLFVSVFAVVSCVLFAWAPLLYVLRGMDQLTAYYGGGM